jgi:hypothetical protein
MKLEMSSPVILQTISLTDGAVCMWSTLDDFRVRIMSARQYRPSGGDAVSVEVEGGWSDRHSTFA